MEIMRKFQGHTGSQQSRVSRPQWVAPWERTCTTTSVAWFWYGISRGSSDMYLAPAHTSKCPVHKHDAWFLHNWLLIMRYIAWKHDEKFNSEYKYDKNTKIQISEWILGRLLQMSRQSRGTPLVSRGNYSRSYFSRSNRRNGEEGPSNYNQSMISTSALKVPVLYYWLYTK